MPGFAPGGAFSDTEIFEHERQHEEKTQDPHEKYTRNEYFHGFSSHQVLFLASGSQHDEPDDLNRLGFGMGFG